LFEPGQGSSRPPPNCGKNVPLLVAMARSLLPFLPWTAAAAVEAIFRARSAPTRSRRQSRAWAHCVKVVVNGWRRGGSFAHLRREPREQLDTSKLDGLARRSPRLVQERRHWWAAARARRRHLRGPPKPAVHRWAAARIPLSPLFSLIRHLAFFSRPSLYYLKFIWEQQRRRARNYLVGRSRRGRRCCGRGAAQAGGEPRARMREQVGGRIAGADSAENYEGRVVGRRLRALPARRHPLSTCAMVRRRLTHHRLVRPMTEVQGSHERVIL